MNWRTDKKQLGHQVGEECGKDHRPHGGDISDLNRSHLATASEHSSRPRSAQKPTGITNPPDCSANTTRASRTIGTFAALIALVGIAAGATSAFAASCRHPEGNLVIERFGDVNHSGITNVADCLCVMLTANAELAGTNPPACLAGPLPEADLNCNGTRTVSDVQLGIAIALGNGLSSEIDSTGDGCPDACAPCAEPEQGSCLIGGSCVPEYGLKQAMACDWCNPTSSAKSWTTATEMTPCSDEGHFCLGGVCLPGLPNPPSDVAATPLHGRVAITFVAPEVLPAVVITGYEVLVVQTGDVVAVSGSPATVYGLTNGAMYTFRVRALTAAGASEWSEPTTAVSPQQCLGEEDGAVCDDGDACTQSDTCQNEACVGANPVHCNSPETQCTEAASCNPASGECVSAPKSNGLSCTATGGCPGACNAGECAGFQVVSAQSNVTQCSPAGTLSATPPTSGSGQWTLVSGSGTIGSPNSATTSVTGLAFGANTFRWTVTGDVCGPNFADVTITRPSATQAQAGSLQQLCQVQESTLAANAPLVGTGTWSVVQGTATVSDPSDPTSEVADLGAGDNILRWTIDAGECGSTHSDVTLRRFLQPEPTSAGSNQLVCVASGALQAAAATAGGGAWSVVSGAAIFSDTASPTSAVSGLGVGDNILRWTVTNGVCEPRTADMTITREQPPTQASTSPDKHVCGDETTITGNSPTVGTGAWSVISGTASFSNPASGSPTVSGMQLGSNTLRWTISTPNCGNSTADITLTRYLVPTTANAGADQNLAPQETETTLNANVPGVGNGVWSVIEGTGILADPTNPQTPVTNLSSGLNVFRWTITNGPCTSWSEVAIVRPMVCTGDRIALTQADIKNFRVCREITGNLQVHSIAGLQDFFWLSNLETVGGYVSIQNNGQLTSLSGMHNLSTVGGYLTVYRNHALTNLSGLQSLAQVGTTISHYVYIAENNLLNSIQGLESLQSVAGTLWIHYNPVLSNGTTFDALQTVTQDIRVEGNPLLSSLTLPSLAAVGRDLSIQRNFALSQCAMQTLATALTAGVVGAVVVADNLTETECADVLVPGSCVRHFDVRRHEEVRRLGLCSSVTGDVTLGNHNTIPANQAFTSLAPLTALENISGNLYIYYMYNTPNLTGLNNLATVGGWFRMHVGSQTTSMIGLDSLQSIGSYLYIDHNHNLKLENGEFPSLVSIGSHLQFWNNHPSGSNYTFNAFPALTTIGGSFYFHNNLRIGAMAGFTALQSTTGYLLFDSNAHMSTLGGFVSLSGVGTYVQISNNHALTVFSGFPSLTTVGTHLTIFQNNVLTEISGFDALTSINGLISIYSNVALTQIGGFGSLTNLNGSLDIYTNANLTAVGGFGALPQVKGYLRIHNNGKLASLSAFAGLVEVGTNTSHYLHITNNPLLTGIGGLSALQVVRGELMVRFNLALPSLASLGSLARTGGAFRVEENTALTELGLAGLGIGAGNGVAGAFTIFGNPALAQCDAYALRDQVVAGGGTGITGAITILENEYDEICPGEVPPVANCNTNHTIANAAGLLALAGCTSISGSITIDGATIVNLAGLQNLVTLGGSLTIHNCPNLINLSHLSSLQSVGGFVSLLSNASLVSLAGLSNVQSIGQYLRVGSNAALTHFGLTSLQTIGQYLYIDYNQALVHITGMDALTSIGHYFYLLGNNNLETITGFSGLQTIGTSTSHYLQIQTNVKLQSLAGLESLHTINGYLYLHTNHALVNMTGLEGLTSISNWVRFYHNNSLENFVGMEALQTIGGHLYIDYQQKLQSLEGLSALQSIGTYFFYHANSNATVPTTLAGLDSLATIGQYIYIESNTALQSISGLDALQTVGQYVYIGHNHGLKFIDGFSSLHSVGAYVRINNNNTLHTIDGFDGLVDVGWNPAMNGTGRYLHIYSNNALLTITGFTSLQTVGSFFRINSNSNLIDLPGLSNLSTVGSYAWIDNNAKLTTLAGLAGLQTVAGYFRVEANALLATLGLAALAQVAGDFIIFNNATLPECAAYGLADSIGGGISGVVTVGSNNTSATCP